MDEDVSIQKDDLSAIQINVRDLTPLHSIVTTTRTQEPIQVVTHRQEILLLDKNAEIEEKQKQSDHSRRMEMIKMIFTCAVIFLVLVVCGGILLSSYDQGTKEIARSLIFAVITGIAGYFVGSQRSGSRESK